MVAGLPGAIVDSSTSNRATTNRTGAIGSSTVGASGAPDAPIGLAPALLEGGAELDVSADALGAAVASGSGIGVTV